MPTVRYTVVDGEVIAEKRNGVRSLYVPDPLGSTVALLDSTQTKTDTFGYWPYGEVRTRTGTTATPFQYVGAKGYYRDSATKTYVRARYLATSTGRWLTEDPIGFKGGDWNLYRYVKSNPTSYVDVSGKAVSRGPKPVPCPTWPPGVCFQCWYNRFVSTGSDPGHACSTAKAICRAQVICDDCQEEECGFFHGIICAEACKNNGGVEECIDCVRPDGSVAWWRCTCNESTPEPE